MKWYIIRHADKEPGDYYNPVLRHQDQPISAEGYAKAKNLYSYFVDKPIANIYISEYVRTGQTIDYVAQKIKLTPIVDQRLNEIDNGVIEGLTEQEIKQDYPEVWNAFNERSADFRFPEGESGAEVLDRIESFFEDKISDNKEIILVSHDGLIRTMMCFILGIPVYRRWDFHVDTCGIMEIEYQQVYKRWKLLRFNHVNTVIPPSPKDDK